MTDEIAFSRAEKITEDITEAFSQLRRAFTSNGLKPPLCVYIRNSDVETISEAVRRTMTMVPSDDRKVESVYGIEVRRVRDDYGQ